VLRKIRDLVNAGVLVVGSKPIDTPSLSDDRAQFRAIADQLWDSGKVRDGQTMAAVLTANNTPPDFDYAKPQGDTSLLFVHRTLPDGEVYWVDNRNARSEIVDATFRVQGKAAEFWRPESGRIESASYTISSGRTIVPLRLAPYEAVFVVFRKPAATPSRTVKPLTETVLGTLEGSWEVTFQPDRGAPSKITLDRLTSWCDSSDPGVKYFAGTATYTKTVQVSADWFKSGARLWLDLGNVKNLAQVSVNGKARGILWNTPFRADITDALKPGANAFEVKVTNLWVNRLIGDAQPGVTKKYTYTTQPFYQADSPLLPSGLLGPVRVVRSAAE
jgi:hypothetical protein